MRRRLPATRSSWRRGDALRALLAGALLLAAAVLAARAADASPASPSAARTSTGAAISLTPPPGWRLITHDITALSWPVERLLVTSYRARRGGNCAPDRAERELPAGGALVYLLEYRARIGAPLTKVNGRAFPPRPAHFSLERRALGNYECWRVPSYLIRFRDAGRAFQVHVALGPRAGPARRTQVLAVLDSLRFSPLR
jgi:hypothetical protein